MMPAIVSDRTSALGSIGHALYKVLEGLDVSYPTSTLEQWVIAHDLHNIDVKAGIAYSMLACNIPIQLRITEYDIAWLVDHSLARIDFSSCTSGKFNYKLSGIRFPLKAHPGATNKVNLYADEVLEGLLSSDSAMYDQVQSVIPIIKHLYDDQISAFVLFAVGLKSIYFDNVQVATRAILDQTGCKSLSTVLKTMGANCSILGAKLCECQCLQGRAVNSIDWDSEIAYRISDSDDTQSCVNIPEQKLRSAIRYLLRLECPREVQFDEPDSFWGSRWSWCVNGSHSKILESEEPDKAVDHTDISHLHRRAYVERQGSNILNSWSGKTYYSTSEKLEQGKTRALFATDTATYICFDHLLRPVEKAWRGVKVDMNPGRYGHWGIANKIRKLRQNSPVNIMLDYEDFNSQHTLRTEQIVIEELINHVNYDAVRGKKLVDSFLRARVFHAGVDKGYLKRTLMSGQRSTSFINSVTNFAYLMATHDGFEDLISLHVGDDVYVCAKSLEIAASLVDDFRRSGLRANAMKQSVGFVCGEFLRIAVNERHAIGYLSRAIASTVSGNWINDTKLGPEESIKSMIGNAWTLMNRSVGYDYGPLLTKCVFRALGGRLSLSKIQQLLSGTLGLGRSCIRGRSSTYSHIDIHTVKNAAVRLERDYARFSSKDHSLATRDYLTNHLSDVERRAIELTGSNPTMAMIESSYRKSAVEAGLDSKLRDIAFSGLIHEGVSSSLIYDDAIASKPKSFGVLASLPVLQLIKGALTIDNVSELLHMVGEVPGRNALETAFGDRGGKVIVEGYLSYSDAADAATRSIGVNVIRSTCPVYV